MIAAADFPLLASRLHRLRDQQATVLELEADMRSVLAAPPPALADEVTRLSTVEPRYEVAIAALIDGTREAWWALRPELRKKVIEELREIFWGKK